MKKFLLLIILAAISFASQAQTGTGTLDESGATISGGDGTGKIVSYSWAVQGTPPASVQFQNASAPVTNVTFTKAGTYNFTCTIKDNLGNAVITTWKATVYDKQIIQVDASKSRIINVQLK